MNLIETIQSIFTKGDFMDDFNGMHIDYTNNNGKDTGLILTNDSKVKEDLLGNITRRAQFTVYRNVYNASDYERLQNSTFILELSSYLESLNYDENRFLFDYNIGKEERKNNAFIKSLQCSNGMMFRYLNGNPNEGAQYMLQLTATYVVQDL